MLALVSTCGALLARRAPFLLLCTAYIFAGSALTSRASSRDGRLSAGQLTAWQEALEQQGTLVAENRRAIAAATAVMQERVATIQARMVRIDAATSALLETSARLHKSRVDAEAVGSVDRTAPPASNGSATQLASILDQAVGELDARERELGVLEDLLVRYKTEPRGRPVSQGWISSRYGERIDPFTGDPANHSGVDIAARSGTLIVAVADGLVSWSGQREGYGQTVEVTHRDGLVTRYAHNQKNLVEVGDIVRRGQPIARLGATGRTTGPHVHFEVLRKQRAVDPTPYLNRIAGEP
jgi:murein DD-endopeptidase MepM/ murein hydrolase activator NlpD